ncbi:hypothetical protein SAMN02745163_02849 [Clostridium cavendishii DSM 21758]|uniref:Lipoprotein n=1 Tax=Clostridium cavendishii DSM 21758 TaxID=1121302 RepID=A0A1M6NAY0_9CLOT|nr:hypothetical protein [Clostridium cavendishii]SHJ92858.1 hypothetical protein SAMN02745163_02849 [Clostridium cavendishii DSM 21758]
MIKKKLLTIGIGLAISTGCSVQAFALDKNTNKVDNYKAKVESKIKDAIKANGLAKQTAELQARAAKLGIDTTGLTNDQIAAKIKDTVKTNDVKKAGTSKTKNFKKEKKLNKL